MRDKLAEVIAEAMGYDISDMHRDKPHWVETGGMLNGRFRDVNDPRADDFADASAAVREYLGSEEVVERVAKEFSGAPFPSTRSLSKARAALSSIMEQSDGR